MTRLLTTAEVADIVRRHPKTVERAIRRGDLRATRLSGADHGPYGVRQEWVDEWIDQRVTAAAPAPMVPPMPAGEIKASAPGRLVVTRDMGRDRAPA